MAAPTPATEMLAECGAVPHSDGPAPLTQLRNTRPMLEEFNSAKQGSITATGGLAYTERLTSRSINAVTMLDYVLISKLILPPPNTASFETLDKELYQYPDDLSGLLTNLGNKEPVYPPIRAIGAHLRPLFEMSDHAVLRAQAQESQNSHLTSIENPLPYGCGSPGHDICCIV